LERHIWARDDEDAVNHIPRHVSFSEEVSRWRGDDSG
jgi:hypothetical protein